MIVRAETPDDHDTIRRIVDEAFGDTITSAIVDGIRASGRFVPELSLVAVSDAQSVGHVISSYVDVVPSCYYVKKVNRFGEVRLIKVCE